MALDVEIRNTDSINYGRLCISSFMSRWIKVLFGTSYVYLLGRRKMEKLSLEYV